MAFSRYQTLVQERADLVREGGTLFARSDSDNRALSAEEMARDDAINARLAEIGPELERLERQRERERAVTGARPIGGDGGAVPTISRQAGRLVDASGVAIPLNGRGFPRLIPAWTEADGSEPPTNRAALKPWGYDTGAPFGEFLQAVHRARMTGETDPRLAYMATAQGAGEATPADGGFLVGYDIAQTLVNLIHAQGKLLQRVRKIPLSAGANGLRMNAIKETSRATGSRWGGVQGYWVDEGTAGTAGRPKFRRVTLELKKLIALGYASDELLADAAALEGVFTQAFAEELAFLAEDAIINGNGVGQPMGILGASCLVSVAKETGQAAATILTTNLSKMWARMLPRSKANAVWLINTDTNPQLDELTIPAGTAAVEPRFVDYGPDGLLRIKGRPVVEIEYAATVGTVGDIILADLGEYLWIERDVQQASSMHVAFTTDEMAFRATYRVDGQPTMESAVTPFKGAANTQSAFVALATRS